MALQLKKLAKQIPFNGNDAMARKRLALMFWLSLCSILMMANAYAACQNDVPVTTPTSRFQVNQDGTVLDTGTGLVWDRCLWGLSGSTCATGTASAFNWTAALQVAQTANGLGHLGYSDWRLPNVSELHSIMEYACNSPTVNTTVFVGHPAVSLWTSTPSTDPDSIFMNFITGLFFAQPRSSTYRVHLVRGGY